MLTTFKAVVFPFVKTSFSVDAKPVSCDPSIAGNLPEPSSCTILPAVVPTSTASVCV